MNSFELTDYSRIFFKDAGDADQLEGHSEKEPNFYDDFYEKGGNPLREVREYQYSHLLHEAQVFKAGDKHLDVGCGDGLFVQMCRGNYSAESFGIDAHAPSNKAFVIKQSLDAYIAQIHTKEFEKLDVISFMDVLEHFKDPSSALQKIKPLMQPDSVLLIKVPSKDSLIYSLARQLKSILPSLSRKTLIRMYQVHYPPPHYFYYNLTSLKNLLQQNDFVVQKHGFVSETPLPVLHKRLWGMSYFAKPFAYLILALMQVFTPRSMYDGVYITAKLRK